MYFVKDCGKSNTHNKYVPIYPFSKFLSRSSLYGPWRKVSFHSRSSLNSPWRNVSFKIKPQRPLKKCFVQDQASMVLDEIHHFIQDQASMAIDEIHHLNSRSSLNGPWRNVSFKKYASTALDEIHHVNSRNAPLRPWKKQTNSRLSLDDPWVRTFTLQDFKTCFLHVASTCLQHALKVGAFVDM